MEEHETRLERNIRLEEWAKMELTEKALMVAARRLGMAMHNLQAEAEIRSAENKANRQ